MVDEVRVMETIKSTQQFVAARGARFVILFCPAITHDVEKYRADWNEALLKLKNWAAQRGVPLLDMSELMAAQSAALVYFDGIHLRPTGDALVADTFVSWFEAHRK
jgi:lysophospholipase L1-like esterase